LAAVVEVAAELLVAATVVERLQHLQISQLVQAHLQILQLVAVAAGVLLH
jgi:hypothetical protein